MNVKGYLGTLIIILALFGISWEPGTVPNQEIVVQFDDEKVTLADTEEAIATVKQRLQLLGAENIQVVEAADGRVKISYYSDIDVAVVKTVFSSEEQMELSEISLDSNEEEPELPDNTATQGYELNVCEIQNGVDTHSDLNGFIPEMQTVDDRSGTPDVYVTQCDTDLQGVNNFQKVAYKAQRTCNLQVDTTPPGIPEVRAGPVV